MSVSRKNKSMKKSYKSRKNIKSSRKTRKNIRKMKGGRKGRRNMRGGKINDYEIDTKIQTTEEFNKYIESIYKNDNFDDNEENLEMSKMINHTVDLNILNNHSNFFTRIDLSYNINLINKTNLDNICELLKNTINLKDLFIARCFNDNIDNFENFKLFVKALGNNKSLEYIDFSDNKLLNTSNNLQKMYEMYMNIAKNTNLNNLNVHFDEMITKKEYLKRLYEDIIRYITNHNNTRNILDKINENKKIELENEIKEEIKYEIEYRLLKSIENDIKHLH
jgi:hypothetical protein